MDHETLDLQDNLSYREYPVRILDQAERTTRRQNIKFLKVQWSHHSEKEATWEREDRLRLEYPAFFPEEPKSRDEILLSGVSCHTLASHALECCIMFTLSSET